MEHYGLELPKKNDKLFNPAVNNWEGAWIGNPSNKFGLYSEGYKKAAQTLYTFYKGNGFFRNTLVYPIVFLYRHFLELRLKELIVWGNDYLENGKDFPDHHDLLILWSQYRMEILVKVDEIEAKVLDNVENLVKEFNSIDQTSFSFRYPVGKMPERKPSLKIETIDLANFTDVMETLINFFDWQKDMLMHYKDLQREMMSDLYGHYYNTNINPFP